MAFEEKTKQKPQRMDVAEWAMLHEIGKAIQAQKGGLTQVRRDSAEWMAWRAWMHECGMTTVWIDRQKPEHLVTVTMAYPPFDMNAEYRKWVKAKGKTLELAD